MSMAGRRRGRCGGGVEVLDSIYSVVALVLILVACVELGDAAIAVDVYRLIQYDLAGVPYGSRLAGLNHHARAYPFAPGADLSRTVVMMPIRELNLTFLREYIINKQPLGGLLFLLPQKVSKKIVGEIKSKDDGLMRKLLVELERLLIHASIPYPVYLAFEDDKINVLLTDVRRTDATGQPATATTGGYKLVVSSPEPKKLSSPTITNIQGWLPGLKGDGDTNQLPTIAVVASYDTFGAAPALSVGSDSNGSGVVALLEIARLFSCLYSNPKTRGRYNLLFGLTSGGPYNYNGTLKWLRSFDQRLRESIDYAICLNSIGSWNNELWIHVSKPPENAYIKQVHESLSDVAKEQGVTIGIKHKKINISDPRVAWEHEQFSRLRITAVTLSELSAAPELLENTGLYDTRRYMKGLIAHFTPGSSQKTKLGDSVDEAAVYRSIRLIAESLAIILLTGILAEVPKEENSSIRELCQSPRLSADASQILIRHIYGYQGRNIQIFADNSSLAVNPYYVKSWLDLLSRTPRVAPFLSKTDPIISALKKELSDHTVEVHVQHEMIDGMFSFYDSTRATLKIYQVAGVAFDLLFLLILGSYLVILFSFLVISTRGLDDLIHMFRRPASRKVKAS